VGEEIEVYLTHQEEGLRETKDSFMAFQKGIAEPVFTIEGFTSTSLPSDNGTSIGEKTLFRPEWAPDSSLILQDQLEKLCHHILPSAQETTSAMMINEMMFYSAERGLEKVSESLVLTMLPEHQKMYSILKRFQKDVRNGKLPYDVSSWLVGSIYQRLALLEKARHGSDEQRLFALVGDNIELIFKKEVDFLSLVMQDDLLEKYYTKNARMVLQYRQAGVFVSLLSHRRPDLKILEIGAGTGGATLPILEVLGDNSESLARFVSYDCTDISSVYFEKLQQKAERWKGLIDFRTLNIENDPAAQGFELESYDLVIAANVLYSTRDIERTMTNVRKLMKPGAKLVLIELMKQDFGISELFGLLPGWFISEEPSRKDYPLLREEDWDSVLRKTGFGKGVELCLRDTPDLPTHQGSTLFATATDLHSIANGMVARVTNGVGRALNGVHFPDCMIVGEPMDAISMSHIRSQFGSSIEFTSISSARPDGRPCIVLSELQLPVLCKPTQEQMTGIKRLCSESSGILWVTRGGAIEAQNPDGEMIRGLVRVLRLELGDLALVTLDLDANRRLDSQCLDAVDSQTTYRIFNRCFTGNTRAENSEARNGQDAEFVERNGIIMIPRFVHDKTVSDFVNSRLTKAMPKPDYIIQPDKRPLKLEIERPGLLDTFYFNDDNRYQGEPSDDELDVEIKAAALNFHDVMVSSPIT
jgi:SAM-dependent methyltransferase